MSTMESILAQPLVEALGWSLVHFIWQGAAVAGLLAVAMLLLRRAASSLRYLASLAALLIMAACPIVLGFHVVNVAAFLSSWKLARKFTELAPRR